VLHPLENCRSNAQFFVTSTFVDYLLKDVILAGPWDSVICIGCPTIFEAVHHSRAHKLLRAFLLDYDTRLYSFFSARQMLIYNMFNGHIFSPRRFFNDKFLSIIKNCLVIVDPPFSAFHRVLAHSIDTLFQCKDIQRNLILFNPYFLERWIADAFPRLNMLDYKIEYASQSALHLCRGKKGSPVRIFTDICPSKFPPLDETNYKYCQECNRYTLVTNQHCFACRACTSKDSLPDRHCSLCPTVCQSSTRTLHELQRMPPSQSVHAIDDEENISLVRYRTAEKVVENKLRHDQVVSRSVKACLFVERGRDRT
jgi:hypothetical protein